MTTLAGEASARPCHTWMAYPRTTALNWWWEVRSSHSSHQTAKIVRA